jgi:hypothetical protein
MTESQQSLFAGLREISGWSGALTGAQLDRVRERLAPTLAWTSPDVSSWILEELEGDQPERGRWLMHALALAGTAGARAVGRSDDVVELMDRNGRSAGLSVLHFSSPAHPAGEPRDVARLKAALDRTFGSIGYVLYLRRPVPSGYDPAPLVRAVRLWVAAIDPADSHHAIYAPEREAGRPEEVEVELTVIGKRRAKLSGRVLTVGPVAALERLGGIDEVLVEAAVRHEDALGRMPMIYCVAASSWRMPRGYAQQLLYGTPEWVCTTSGDQPTYHAAFRPNGRCMYNDPICSNVASLWWMEGHGDDPLGFSSWAHDNPWCSHQVWLNVDGSRFAIKELGDHGGPMAMMVWTGASAVWTPLP